MSSVDPHVEMVLNAQALSPAGEDGDRNLLRRYQRQRDMDAFASLVDRHQADLLRTAHAILGDAEAAQDAVQESFICLCREAEKLLVRLNADNLGGWLTTVLRNRCIDELRRRQSQRLRSLPDEHPAAPVVTGEADFPIWQVVEVLPALERSAIVLRYRDNLSYDEIAQRLGKTVNHIGVILHQAMQRLRSHPALRREGQP